ncbi:FadR/GntR family transcriptional regulator [Planctomicrobium sp. SH668]|uniref:FadR/GntR family transcriptional regulator n=1 Tax=Planctomicrobium sp. SH668 TaxID=3448126 RepID=UPI003F5BE50A
MLKVVGRSKIRDVVAKRLKEYILDAGLNPGDRLPTESELAVTFGVSRLSLREATKSLEYFGIVESKPGRGLSVGSVDIHRVTECIGFHPALLNAELHQLVGSRVALETGVLAHVSESFQKNPAWYEELCVINQMLREAVSAERFIEIDIEFHRKLMQASGLTPLAPFADVLAVFFQRFRKSVQNAEWSVGIESHQKLIDDLRDGNVARASRELRAHIESHINRMES